MEETTARRTGAVQAEQKKRSGKSGTAKICENMTFAAREAFKRLRTNVLISFSEEEKACRVIGITSAQPSEGKSTISVNLAYSLAELGNKVVLIDGDMRRPSIHDKLGFRQSPGLADLLAEADDVGPMLIRYQSRTDGTCFDVITSGEIARNPSELMNSKRAEKLMQLLGTVYDYIVFDLPPVGAVVDAVTASRLTDGMIVVVRENNCPRYILEDCVDQLTYAKANVIGFVMNGSVEGAGKQYKNGSGYYKYGGAQSNRRGN